MLILTCTDHNSFAQKNYDRDAIENKEEYADTVLRKTLFEDKNKSVEKWKQYREFAYMKYLDSLLKKRSDLKSDTLSIDQSNGKVKGFKKNIDNSGINKFLNSLPLKIFFWALAISFIGFIFYKLFFQNGIFDSLKSQNIEIIDKDAVTHLSEFSEYEKLMREAESQNNFNLSTRFLYLQTLKILFDKGFINFAPEKTNKQYLHEMESNSHSREFALLTRNYEYVWYGKFSIDYSHYQKLKNEFILFNKKV
ncbi:MAG: hypothetical protein M3Z26_02920 [Bacteroidota bacterium]|nr:hypothetical protein [Bacteroidota bacterium]